MENTKENKERFFGQYLGQEVLSHPEYNGETVLIDNFIINHKIIDDGYFLELKHLSSITEEDLDFLGWGISEIKDIEKEAYISGFETDYLRSKGYAICWLGLSIDKQIQFGWVKLKTTQDAG